MARIASRSFKSGKDFGREVSCCRYSPGTVREGCPEEVAFELRAKG